MQRYVAWARVLVLVLIMFPMVGSFQSVSAQGEASTPAQTFVAPKFSIQPAAASATGWLQTELEPGSTQNLAVLISNFGTVAVELRTYAGDAYSMVNGGFSVYDESSVPVGPGSWVAYEPGTFSLEPGESITRELTVSVPEGTKSGQYVSGIVVHTATPLEIPGSATFSQIIQSSMAIEVNVPGERVAAFELGTPTFTANESVRTLLVPIVNTGNVLVKPTGPFRLTDETGAEVMSAEIELGSIYSGTETQIKISIPLQFPLGTYQVSIDLTDQASGVQSAISDAPAELGAAAPVPGSTFAVESVSVTPNADPIQYANVQATINNPMQMIATANITLEVSLNGTVVEEFPLASNLAIANGITPFEARYIPESGWSSGTYSFTFTVSAVNASDSSETTLASVDVTDKIVVP